MIISSLNFLCRHQFFIRLSGVGSQPNIYRILPHSSADLLNQETEAVPLSAAREREAPVPHASTQVGAASPIPNSPTPSPPAATPEQIILRLIAAFYRPLTDHEFAALQTRIPDNGVLQGLLLRMYREGRGAMPDMTFEFFVSILQMDA